MAMTDPIGDMITRIRNAQQRAKSKVSTPGSKLRERVLEVLKTEGYIRGYATLAHSDGRSEIEIELKYFDGGGNYTLGIKEHIIFPEIDYDKATDIWGMDITVCTTARTDAEARALLTAFNFPFRQ